MGTGASLVVVASPSRALLGKRVPLERRLVIGSDASCDIPVDELMPRHAVVSRFGDAAFEVETLHPEAALAVNGESKSFGVLQAGDALTLGRLRVVLVAGPDADSDYHELIYRLTITDPDTELFNRRHLLDALERELSRARRHGTSLSLVVLRLLGAASSQSGPRHAELLRTASVLRNRTPEGALLSRTDERDFVLVLPDTPLESSREHAASLTRAIADDADCLSAAAAVTLGEESDATELLERAVRAVAVPET